MASTYLRIARENRILPLCDGVLSSREIAVLAGDNEKYVQRVMKKHNAPRLRQSPPNGERNPAYKSGRKIDRDGYVLISAPLGHPYARMRAGRIYGLMYEHRLVLESKIGRYLLPQETVDHIDGIRLHNHPSNLRLFDCNAAHLRATITGQIPKWSEAGVRKLNSRWIEGLNLQPVNTYNLMKKSGDARLKQILLAMMSLPLTSPYLLGTIHHLEKAGIFDYSHSNLEHELDKLYHKYA